MQEWLVYQPLVRADQVLLRPQLPFKIMPAQPLAIYPLEIAPGGSSRRTNHLPGNASAAQAIMIAQGEQNGGQAGSYYFNGNSSGGTAYLLLVGNSALDISGHNLPGLVGTLTGDGQVFLGANNYRRRERLSGYADRLHPRWRQCGGPGGSLTKVGHGQLTLSGASSYSGGTVVASGILTVNNTEGSATGSGPVQVQPPGLLNGSGVMLGPVTVSGVRQNRVYSSLARGSVGQLTTRSRLCSEAALIIAPSIAIQ